jgi:hypothetical protein
MERTKYPDVIEYPVLSRRVIKVNGKIIIQVTFAEMNKSKKWIANTFITLSKERGRKEEHVPAHTYTRIKTEKIESTLSLNERNNLFIPLAEKLYKIIYSKRKIKYNQTHLKTWATEIRKLNEMYGIEISKIDKLLDWYADNIGGAYIPVIESGYSLRMKYQSLRRAMERSFQPSLNHPPIYDDGMRFDYNEKDGRYHHHRTGKLYIP